MKKLLSFLVWGLASCASLEQELDPKVYYERSLRMEVKAGKNNYTFRGVGVLPLDNKYEIEISNPNRGKLDFVRFTTCHRERTYSSEGRILKIDYSPTEIELTGSCLIKFEAYSMKGKHGWGILDISSHKEKLYGLLRCNGETYRGAVSICQSRAGLEQEIEFEKEVEIASQQGRCKITSRNRFKKLRFKIPNRECVYYIRGDNGGFHRLSTIGSEGVLIPSND